MKVLAIMILMWFSGFCICAGFFSDTLTSYKVEKRMKALGLMKYDSKTNSFVFVKDTLVLTKEEMKYIQNGSTK